MIKSQLIKPMEPVLAEQIIDSKEYVYQVKWDGVRILSYLEKGKVTLINKKLNDRTLQYPELQNLAALLAYRDAVLDGELIILNNGRPSLPLIMSRDNCRTSNSIEYLSRAWPVDYMIFDILRYNSTDLTGLPLMERKTLLEKLPAGKHLFSRFHIVEDFLSGNSLYKAIQEQEMEGIVAKKKDSRYIEGKRHREWFKIKNRLHLQGLIGGYTARAGIVNSLLLGIFRDDQLLYIGKSGNGLKDEEWHRLSEKLPNLSIDYCPFANLIPETRHKVFFVQPIMAVKIEFAEWTDNLRLRSPVIKGFVVDAKA